MTTNKNLPYYLAALHANIHPTTLLAYLAQTGSIESFFNHSLPLPLLDELTPTHPEPPNWSSVESDLAWAQHPDHHLICYDDPAYPPLLKELSAPPYLLYVRGNPTVLNHLQIGIVGARNATPQAIRSADHFARTLSEAGLAITSGLARGIDTASHQGALSANGITLGVAGTGLQQTYPRSNQRLVETIIQKQGAILSEFPLATPPYAANFPRRNRIIAALTLGILVVEAALKSGSLITANLAAEAGREVFAIPGSIHHPLSRGCHHLIKQGAKLVESTEDILSEFSTYQLKKLQPAQKRELLSTTEQQIWKYIAYQTTPLDVIILRSRLTASELSAILLTLELKGYIQTVPGGYIRTGISN